MNHNESLKIIFRKRDIPNIAIGIIFFIGLFIFYMLQGSILSFVFFLFALLVVPFYFFVRANKLYKKVYRLNVDSSPPRLYIEYWKKSLISQLPSNCFWLEHGRYTPLILESTNEQGNKDFKRIDPFINGDPTITSGQLYRSLVQKATNLLMKPEKSELIKAIETGALFLLTGGGALVIISLFGQINKGAEIATGG